MDFKILLAFSITFVAVIALLGSDLTGFAFKEAGKGQVGAISPDWEKRCDGNSCESVYSIGRRFYFEDGKWDEIKTNLERDESASEWKTDKNNFKVRVKENRIRLFDNEDSIEFEVPFSDPMVSDNVISYSNSSDAVNSSLTLTVISEGIEKMLVLYNWPTDSDFEYTEKIDVKGDRFVVKKPVIWDSSCDSFNETEETTCEKNYYQRDWIYEENQIKLVIDKDWLAKAIFPIYIDPTTVYTFSDSTNNKAHKNSAAGNIPPSFTNSYYWGGTEATSGEYTNLASDNTVYANSTSAGANQEPYWRFNMTINESVSAITSINITVNGLKNAAEAAACYIANFTGAVFNSMGTLTTSDSNIVFNITNNFAFYIDGESKLVLLCQGDNFDLNVDWVAIDYVEVRVAYLQPPQWSNNVSSTPTEYNPNTLSRFNTTWEDDADANGYHTALFETNLTGSSQNFTTFRFTGTNISSFNATYSAGAFYGRFFANDSNNMFNVTSNFTFTINQNTSTAANLTISPGNTTYPTATTTTCTETNPEASGNLYRNDSLANSENNTAIILAANTWQYKCNVTSQNYSTATNTSILIINKRPVNVSLYLNGTEANFSYDQGTVANFTAKLNISAVAGTNSNVSLNSSYPNWIIQSNETVIYNFTTLSTAGTDFNLSAYPNDTENNTFTTRTFFFNVTVSNTPPTYSANATSVANNSQYVPGRNYGFQINWTDAETSIHTVLFESNLSLTLENTTASNNTPQTWFVNFTDRPAGLYVYRWIANDTEGMSNSTQQLAYVIARNTSTGFLHLAINGSEVATQSYTYPEVTNATGWKDFSEGTLDLYRNDSIKSTGQTPNEIIRLGASVYNYTVGYNETQNYTASSKTVTLTINQGTPDLKLYIDDLPTNKTIMYPSFATIRGNSTTTITPPTFNLYRNLTGPIATGNPAVNDTLLGSSVYRFEYNTSGNQNWTAASNNSLFLTVQQNNTNPVNLELNGTLNNNRTYTFPEAVNATGSAVYSNSGTVNLYRNGTSVSNPELIQLGNATYAYKVNITGNTNYTSNSSGVTFYAFVNKGTPQVNLTITPASPITYETQTNATCWGSPTILSFNLYRNNVLVNSENATLTTLGVGTHDYACNTTGNANWSAVSNTSTGYTVNQKTININLTLNGTQSNSTYVYPESINATGFKDSTINNEGTVSLFRNGTQVASGSTATELIKLANSTYNYSITFSATNYTASSIINRFAFVNKGNASILISVSPGNTTYPTQTTTQCTRTGGESEVTLNLYRNGSLANSENNTAIRLAANTYQYICNYTTTQNYSSNSTSSILIISQNTSTQSFMNLTLNNSETNQTFTYPAASNMTGNYSTSVFGDQSIIFTLYNNTSSIGTSNPISDIKQLAANVYAYVYNTSGNENYSSASKTIILTINKANNPVNLFLNDTLNNNKTYKYPQAINATGNSSTNQSDISVRLFRNGTLVASGNPNAEEDILLGPASYQYKVNVTSGQNYSANDTGLTFFAFVSKGDVETQLLINGSRANRTVSQYKTLNFTSKTNVSGRSVELWTNFSDGVWKKWDGPATEPLINLTNMTVSGIFNFTANFSGDANYTSDLETWNVTVTEVDLTPPQWSNNVTNPASPTTYSPGGTYQFNTTWTDNIGVSDVYFEWNGAMNYTFLGGEVSKFSDVYVRNMADLAAGSYTYRWFAVDGGDNWNVTPTNNYQINKANPTGNMHVAINGSETNQEKIYPNATNTTGFVDLANNQDMTFNLYRTSLIASGDPATEIILLGVGNYTYVYNTSGGVNYTSASVTRLLNITQNTTNYVDLYLNGNKNQNLTITYGTQSNATAASAFPNSGTVSLFRDGVSASNPEIATLAAKPAGYVYKTNSTGNTNYTTNSTGATFYLFVNRAASALNVSFSPASTVTYPTTTTTNCNIITGDQSATLTLQRNGTTVSSGSGNRSETILLGAAVYNYTCIYSESQNFSASSSLNNFLTVNKANNIVNLYLNDTKNSNRTYTYPEAVNATAETEATDTTVTAKIWRDDSLIAQGYPIAQDWILLGNGTTKYKANATSSQNYSANDTGVTFYALINKGPTLTRLFLNGTEGNRTYNINEIANFTVVLNVSGKTVNLNSSYPGWLVQTGTTPLTNITNLTTNGTYNVTGYFPGDQNYSSSLQTWFASVQGPYIEAELVTPTGLTLVEEGNEFLFNTSFTCRAANCGSINITPRADGDVLNSTTGLRTNDTIQVLCTLNKDQSCFANWTILAASLGSYDLDANATGSLILPNDTADVLISVFRIITEVKTVSVGGVFPGPLLDLEITNLTPIVFAGDRLYFTLLLTNIGNNQSTFDAVVHKRIRDLQSNLVLEEALTRAMRYNLSISDSMQIPRDFQPGRYFFELFVEYVNRQATAIATFEVKKDCFVLDNAQFDLLRRKPVLISDSLDNIRLVFKNVCGISLTSPVLFLDGNEIKLQPTVTDEFEVVINFDRFGGHNATIEYLEGVSRIDFSIESFIFNIAIIISILAVAGFAFLGYMWFSKHEIPRRFKIPLRLPKVTIPKITLPKIPEVRIPKIKLPEVKLPEAKVIPRPVVQPEEAFILQNREEIKREFIRRLKRKLREGGYL